jgi:hypothetical protein
MLFMLPDEPRRTEARSLNEDAKEARTIGPAVVATGQLR